MTRFGVETRSWDIQMYVFAHISSPICSVQGLLCLRVAVCLNTNDLFDQNKIF